MSRNTAYIGLLRAVNLPGHNKIRMADLRDLVSGLGFENPQTLLQSGNVVFRGDAGTADGIESQLETAAKSRLGLDTAFMVRTADEWTDIIARNPFPEEAESDPAHLVVMFLKKAPADHAVVALREAIRGREVVRAGGREAYIVYPDGIGRSKLTAALIDGKLGVRGTGRNWNTVLKLDALADGQRKEA